MKKWIIIPILLLLVALSVLTACGNGDDDKTPASTETTQPTQTTAKPTTPAVPAEPEETLTVALQLVHGAPEFGPFERGADAARSIWSAMADYLVLEKSDGSGYVPSLAEQWEVSSDETSITFKLRQGVQFHDGWGELTADDVKFTIETSMDQRLGGQWGRVRIYLAPLVDRIETSGPYELTIYCTGPWANGVLAYLCPNNEMGLGIVSKAYYDETGIVEGNKHPIFSGPYKLVNYTLGEKMELEAVSDHWRVVPEFKNLIFREVPELSTRVSMLQAGEADIVQTDPDQAVWLQDTGFDLTIFPRTNKLALALCGQWLPERETYDSSLPWLDKRVRQAMNLAIDREEMVEHLFHGMAEPLADMLYLSFDQSREPYPYDPERASQLMAEAGYADGFDADMWIFVFPGAPDPTDTMLAVAGYWDELGINFEITSQNVMAVYGEILGRSTTGVCMPWMAPKDGDPDFIRVVTPFSSIVESTYPMYESPESDAIAEQYFAASTVEDKENYLLQLVQHLYDEYAFVPLFFRDSPYALGDRLSNWGPQNWDYPEWEYITHAEPLGTFRLFEKP